MAELKTFTPAQIYLTRDESLTVIKFFWPDLTVDRNSITADDIAYAQGLLVEAIDASYELGYVHLLYDSFYMKPVGSFEALAKITKSFVKKAAKHWFKNLHAKQSLDDAKIYNAVRGKIAQNFKSDAYIRFVSDKN